MREPKILLVGKNTDSLEILRDELIKFGRQINIASNENEASNILNSNTMDIAILGAGLSDDAINVMADFIKKLSSSIMVDIMEKKPGMNPTSMIGYANEKAVMWKLINARQTAK